VAKPPPPASSRFWTVFNALGRLQVRLMHLTHGRVGAKLMRVPVLVLHHRGRRSGQARETPLMYLEDGADVVVVGSKGGTDTHPAWFHNLIAMSETEVQVGGERRRVRPTLADAEERARLWPRLVELYPPYEEYQGFTSREIPVVLLKPAG
jgi:deazaflavin-dependent oxidoreductase (nitroreductase family)